MQKLVLIFSFLLSFLFLSQGATAQEGTVFGEDDRVPVADTTAAPYNAICKLKITYQNGTTGDGTGFLYGPGLLATAGHCLYDTSYGRGGQVASVTVYPGLNAEGAPFGSRELREDNAGFYLPERWKQDRDWRFDYGVIAFFEPFEEVQPLQLADWETYPDSALAGTEALIAGYDGAMQSPLLAHGMLSLVREDDLLYRLDISHGQSGAPILDLQSRVIGIQNYGANVGFAAGEMPYNSGARMNRTLSEFLLRVENISSPS